MKILRSKCLSKYCLFNWHAGEPLLAGIEFYSLCLDFQKKYNVFNKQPLHSIQTNAVLINQKWCDFFKDNNISVAVSCDGPEFIHNINRKNWRGKGSYNHVMKGINYLVKNDIPFGNIAVITKESLKYPEEIMRFFIENGFKSVAFNFEEELVNNKSSLLNVTNEIDNDLKNFIDKVYKIWQKHSSWFRIREINKFIAFVDKKKSVSTFRVSEVETEPLSLITIKKNGDIIPFSPELAQSNSVKFNNFNIGNISDLNSLDDLIYSENLINIYNEITKGVKKCLNECEYYDFCGGGSPSSKYFENKTFNSSETSWCKVQKKMVFSNLCNLMEGSAC